MADEDTTIPVSNVIKIDEERIKGHLDRVVRARSRAGKAPWIFLPLVYIFSSVLG